MKKELNIIIAAAAVWCAGFILAPILSGSAVSVVLYKIYAVVCHQFESRSFHLNGEPAAVCIRCSAIYLAFFVTLILVRTAAPLRTTTIKAIPLLIVTGLPMAADGLFSLFGSYHASGLSRALTGSLFGFGMAMLLQQPLTETVRSLFNHSHSLS